MNGALPPDLSLIVNAREGHANYVYGILTGFTDPPKGFEVPAGRYYNQQFPGHLIAMPPPLHDGGGIRRRHQGDCAANGA